MPPLSDFIDRCIVRHLTQEDLFDMQERKKGAYKVHQRAPAKSEEGSVVQQSRRRARKDGTYKADDAEEDGQRPSKAAKLSDPKTADGGGKKTAGAAVKKTSSVVNKKTSSVPSKKRSNAADKNTAGAASKRPGASPQASASVKTNGGGKAKKPGWEYVEEAVVKHHEVPGSIDADDLQTEGPRTRANKRAVADLRSESLAPNGTASKEPLPIYGSVGRTADRNDEADAALEGEYREGEDPVTGSRKQQQQQRNSGNKLQTFGDLFRAARGNVVAPRARGKDQVPDEAYREPSLYNPFARGDHINPNGLADGEEESLSNDEDVDEQPPRPLPRSSWITRSSGGGFGGFVSDLLASQTNDAISRQDSSSGDVVGAGAESLSASVGSRSETGFGFGSDASLIFQNAAARPSGDAQQRDGRSFRPVVTEPVLEEEPAPAAE